MESNIIENADIRRFNISQRGEITKASIFLQVMVLYQVFVVTKKKKENKRKMWVFSCDGNTQLAWVVNISPNL